MINTELHQHVDVVISWVDGNDPKQAQKIQQHIDPQFRKHDDVAGATRYTSVGEIFYSVGSILRFAPFVRKIFIITDQQNPNLDAFVARNFPDTQTEIELVDHRVIFRDYETVLPVFNSRTIETATFRIPGLSENYVYLNDDFFLVRPVSYNDWYVGDDIVAYGAWHSLFLYKLLWLIKPTKNGHKPVGFKDAMIKAAEVFGQKKQFFHLEHMPHPMKKSVLAKFFEANPALFNSNIAHKFRSGKQFNTQALYYLIMFNQGRAILKSTKDVFLYLKPVNRGDNYINRKLKQFNSNPSIQFCCMGSLDMATEAHRTTLLEWLATTINIKL